MSETERGKAERRKRQRLELWERQNRQLRASDPPRLDDGRRLIRMYAEYGDEGDLPLWEDFAEHSFVDRDTFPISEDLLDALVAWNAEWQRWTEGVDDAVVERSIANGRAYVARLRTELYGIAEIRAEFEH
ncbi:MAG: hypothetical protein P0Y60_03450 [Candidatus Microbacterium colombiense]|nr:MAG: hypothetical protein P0Y60_03450 [Microbacterium sp.]